MIHKNYLKTFLSIFIVLLGNFIYAMTVTLFLLPAGLITGGTTGIALFISHLSGCSVSLFVLIFNICMLIIGWVVLGKQFALTTLLSTFSYPVFLEICSQLTHHLVLTEDLLLCTIFSGLGIGLALGIVIRAGASTGGMDIPPLVINHYFKIPVSVSLYVFDFLILFLQMLFQPIENVLYGIILVMIYSIILDKLLFAGTSRIEVKVISDKSDLIRDAILHQLDRGVTMLSSHGGYLKKEGQMVFSVISNRELARIEKLIHTIDPDSFMVISQVKEVSGKGFTLDKVYR